MKALWAIKCIGVDSVSHMMPVVISPTLSVFDRKRNKANDAVNRPTQYVNDSTPFNSCSFFCDCHVVFLSV